MAQINILGTRELDYRPSAYSVAVPSSPPGKVFEVWTDEVEALGHWVLAYTDSADEDVFGAPPLVAEVEIASKVTGKTTVRLDAQLLPDVGYTLTTTAFGGTVSTALTGPRRARADVQGVNTEVLLDIDAPLVRETGRGGDYSRQAGGDLAMTGGLATIERLIWHRLLVRQGELDWAPAHGSRLALKELRPRELRAEERRLAELVREVPGVRSAAVSILFEDDHAVVAIRAETDFGELQARRTLGAP